MGAATEVGSWQLQHLVLTQNRLVKGWPTWADERRGDAAPKPQAPSLMGVASVRGGDLSKGLYYITHDSFSQAFVALNGFDPFLVLWSLTVYNLTQCEYLSDVFS